MIHVSPDQKIVLDALTEWFKKDKDVMPYVTFGGFAGTGKTTLISLFRKELFLINPKISVGFVSYTGKATRVLHKTLETQNAVYPHDSVTTIHGLIYTPIVNENEDIIGWKTKDKIDKDIVIVDEASMVDSLIWEHLRSYKVPIVVVGDHGQLPPIRGSFNLMEKPDLTLTAIHRQAEHNPIIQLSVLARTTGVIPVGTHGVNIRKFHKTEPDAHEYMNDLLASYNNDTLILCGYNTTRKRLNSTIRGMLGFEFPYPSAGDRVICLRNNHKENIFNGMIGTVKRINLADNDWYDADIQMDGNDDVFSGLISAKQFDATTAMNFTENRKETLKGDLFDFGYALTVHKAQGSQSKRVILFEERFPKMDDSEWRRWLYTAVTRAEEELFIFG